MANILVIDDDRDVRQILQVMLRRGNHTVEVASGGRSGLEAAARQSFDLVIADVMMPDLDGYQVARQLRGMPGSAQSLILILTARAQPADYQAALAAGADAYLSKPVTHDVLNAKITELLQQKNHVVQEVAAPPRTPSLVAAHVPSLQNKVTTRRIAVLAMQGGTGATTVAVNTAVALARLHKPTCLLDVGDGIGQAHWHLGLDARHDWQDVPLEPEAKHLGKILTKHTTGLFLLAGPSLPPTQPLPPHTLQKMLLPLGSFFTHIVLDLPHTLAGLSHNIVTTADQILLLVRPNGSWRQMLQATLAKMDDLGVPKERVRIIFNQPFGFLANEWKAPADYADSIVLPFDENQAAAFDSGQPLTLSNPNSPLARTIGRFAHQVLAR